MKIPRRSPVTRMTIRKTKNNNFKIKIYIIKLDAEDKAFGVVFC